MIQNFLKTLFIGVGLVALLATTTACSVNQAKPAVADNAEEYGNTVAQWQIAANSDLTYLPGRHEGSSYDRGWVKGTFFIGLNRFAKATDNQDYFVYLRQKALDNGFEIGRRTWHGDDQIAGAWYGDVVLRDGTPERLKPTLEEFDAILADRPMGSLEFFEGEMAGSEGTCQRRWCWADAIFMAPPAWAKMTEVTGDPKYLQYAMEEAKATIDYLFDYDTNLIFRDSRYFDQRTENGKKVYWSRGNGWVFAGLARFLELIPEGTPGRAYFEDIFQKMADALVPIQRDNGFWPTSLADDALFPNPETSGTAFFTFGMAWGLNNGVLKGAAYESALESGWAALQSVVTEDGKVGWVQQIGKDPQANTAEDSQLYATGGFLLTAAEMVKRGQ